VLSTVAFLPGALGRWVYPKELLLGVAALVASAAVPRGRLPRWFGVGVAVAAAILIASSLANGIPLEQQLFGRWPREEGIVTSLCYVAAAWIGARLVGPASTVAERERLATASSVIALLIAAEAVFEAVGLRPIPSDLARPGSLLGNASDEGAVAAMLAVLLVPFALVPVRERTFGSGRSWLWATGAGAAALAAVLSASRAALLGLVLAGAASAVYQFFRARRRRSAGRVVAVSAVAFGCIALFALAVPATRSRILGTSPLSGATVTERFDLWTAALRETARSPLLGTGPNSFSSRLGRFLPQHWFAQVGVGTVTDSPHSVVLQAYVAGGLSLLLLLVVLASLALRGALSRIGSQTDAAHPAARKGNATTAGISEKDRLVHTALALGAFAVALVFGFTSIGTTGLACLLVGSLIAQAPTVHASVVRLRIVAAGWSALVVVLASALTAELALGAAVRATNAGDQRAAGLFSAAATFRPADADIALIAAESYAQVADRTGASEASGRTWALRAVAELPHDPRSHTALAVEQQYAGDTAGALRELNAAISLSPHDPQLLFRAGALDATTGDLSGAAQLLQKAARLDPADKAIRSALDQVRAAAAG